MARLERLRGGVLGRQPFLRRTAGRSDVLPVAVGGLPSLREGGCGVKMKIFVGNVDGADTTPEELAALFAPYGTVMSCAVMKQFAFVHMRENAGAVRAIEALHGHELRPGRALVVEMSRPRPLNTWKIFVGNVSAACTSQELRSLFERRGRVIECDVVKGNAGARLGRGRARCTQPISHAPYGGGLVLAVGNGGEVRERGPKVLGASWVPPPSPAVQATTFIKWEESALGGCSGHC